MTMAETAIVVNSSSEEDSVDWPFADSTSHQYHQLQQADFLPVEKCEYTA